MTKKRSPEVVLVEQIEPRILVIRGQRVILDADLAALYGVPTKALNQAVKRNLGRFPQDFMFQLTAEEAQEMRSQTVTANLRSQIVTSSLPSHGGRRYLPYAFTEHGAIMAASVLNTPRAIDVVDGAAAPGPSAANRLPRHARIGENSRHVRCSARRAVCGTSGTGRGRCITTSAWKGTGS